MNYELIKSELKELRIHWELSTSYIWVNYKLTIDELWANYKVIPSMWMNSIYHVIPMLTIVTPLGCVMELGSWNELNMLEDSSEKNQFTLLWKRYKWRLFLLFVVLTLIIFLFRKKCKHMMLWIMMCKLGIKFHCTQLGMVNPSV